MHSVGANLWDFFITIRDGASHGGKGGICEENGAIWIGNSQLFGRYTRNHSYEGVFLSFLGGIKGEGRNWDGMGVQHLQQYGVSVTMCMGLLGVNYFCVPSDLGGVASSGSVVLLLWFAWIYPYRCVFVWSDGGGGGEDWGGMCVCGDAYDDGWGMVVII